MSGRGAIAPACALWLGLCVAGSWGVLQACVALALGVALVGLALRAPRRTGSVALCLALALLGASRGAAHSRRLEAWRASLPAADVPLRIRARVTEPPRRESGEPVARIEVDAASVPLAAGIALRLRMPGGSSAECGDEVLALVRLDRVSGARNPGGFDGRYAADAATIAAHARAFTLASRGRSAPVDVPTAVVLRVRRALERAWARTLSAGARELVTPLVLGDRSAMTTELDASLRASGLVHLLALSGLHVVWLAAVARGTVACAGAGVRGRAIAGASCAIGYALLAGPLPSLMRAAAGELTLALARLTGRACDPLQALAISALALLAWRPGWGSDLGFQLSCAATLGLVAIGPIAEPWTRRAGRLGAPLAMLAATAAAQLAALPLLLARFHALAWTGLGANLLAVPLAELLLAAGWLAGIGAALHPALGWPWVSACEVLAPALRGVSSGAAGMPAAVAPAGSEPGLAWLAGAGALLLALALPGRRALDAQLRGPSRTRTAAAWTGGLAIGIALVGLASVRPLVPPPGRWWLVVLDVGQGDALALGFEHDWWLVDAGARSPHWDAGEGVVLPYFRWAGVRRLAVLALTHDDGDHTGGAAAVRRGLRVERTLAPAPNASVAGPAGRFGASAIARGDSLRGRPRVRVLWPPRPDGPDVAIATRGDNAASLVLEVGEGRGRAMLTADADSLVERALDVEPGVAVLKVGHHGSGSSSGAGFLERARPARAVVSVGRRNAYGHPSAGALTRLAAAGARIERTDEAGAIWYEFGPDGAERIDWRRAIPRPAVDPAAAIRPRPRP